MSNEAPMGGPGPTPKNRAPHYLALVAIVVVVVVVIAAVL